MGPIPHPEESNIFFLFSTQNSSFYMPVYDRTYYGITPVRLFQKLFRSITLQPLKIIT